MDNERLEKANNLSREIKKIIEALNNAEKFRPGHMTNGGHHWPLPYVSESTVKAMKILAREDLRAQLEALEKEFAEL